MINLLAARYQHLSSSFLTEAVGKLDSVFEAARYQDVPLKTYLLKESLQVVERKLAAHTGLEPVISALRGQRVNRLHQCAAADWNYRCAAVAEASWRVRRRRSQFCNGSSWMRSVPQRGSVRSASSINIFIECGCSTLTRRKQNYTRSQGNSTVLKICFASSTSERFLQSADIRTSIRPRAS